VGRWCRRPGILWLLDLIGEHRAALEYDWRTRFGLPLAAVGSDAMTYGEAARLVTELFRDPSAHTSSAVAGWDHPWSWAAVVGADLYDLTLTVNSRKGAKREPYPRPWPLSKRDARRRGDAAGRDPDEVRALLARMREGVPDGG
jgi:hypothetical protein